MTDRKTKGQIAYEADVAKDPYYLDGAPRKKWHELDEDAKSNWGPKVKIMTEWQPIASAPEFETVRVFHHDDLYPITAYRVEDEWRYVTDGPEDEIIAHGHQLLYRAPTHWMPIDFGNLPTPPEKTP